MGLTIYILGEGKTEKAVYSGELCLIRSKISCSWRGQTNGKNLEIRSNKQWRWGAGTDNYDIR